MDWLSNYHMEVYTVNSADAIFVLGMIRSGTSALTRVLSLSGCTLPDKVLGAQEENPRGFWDPVEAVKLNSEFLLKHGTWFGDPTLRFDENCGLNKSEQREFSRRIEAFLTACPRGPFLIIKDQHITELMNSWLDAAQRSGFSVKVIIPLRHPREVSASVGAPGSMPIELADAMWLKYNLLSERRSRGRPRVVVEYTNLLRNWKTEVRRVATELGINLTPDSSLIDQFLTTNLRHQNASGPITKTFGDSWISRVYEILYAAACGGDIDQSTLDEIYDAYCAHERTFRLSLESWTLTFNPQQIRNMYDQWPEWKSGRDFS